MVHGGMTLVKYLTFLFNFIFWLSGIGLIVAGAVVEIEYKNYIDFLGNQFLSAPILFIVTGCIIAVIGFFGCCGAIRESYCMIMTFAVLLAIVGILELAAGITSYVLRYDLENFLKTQIHNGMNLYRKNGSEGVTHSWNYMQQELQCCGLEKHWDWKNSTFYMEKPDLPDSCCRKETPACARGIYEVENKAVIPEIVFNQGCLKQFYEWVERHIAAISGIACSLVVIEVLGICFACCLSKSILKEYDDYYY